MLFQWCTGLGGFVVEGEWEKDGAKMIYGINSLANGNDLWGGEEAQIYPLIQMLPAALHSAGFGLWERQSAAQETSQSGSHAWLSSLWSPSLFLLRHPCHCQLKALMTLIKAPLLLFL